MPSRKTVLLYINGQRLEVGPEHAGMMLADYLRYQRGLTGTKIVCAEGDCGACTVLRSFPAVDSRFLPLNACIITVAQMDASSIVTVDALDGTPAQEAMTSCHGSQCGFCTPGFVMALTGLAEKKVSEKKGAAITAQAAKNSMTGNLCRCTGYQPIIDAALKMDLSKFVPVRKEFSSPIQERELKRAFSSPVAMEGERFAFYAPKTAREASTYLSRHRDARLIGGATDLGVVHNKEKIRLSRLVSLHLIPELYRFKKTGSRVRVGARVSLSDLRRHLKVSAPEFARFLDLFASPQIKNFATLIGNVGNASPIADTPPFLLVSQATVEIQSPRGRRTVPLDRFYLGYRQTALKAGELIVAISIALPAKGESQALYKVSQRKDLDISGVNAAFQVAWKDATKTRIREARVAMGGVAATPIRLPKTEKFLRDLEVTAPALERAIAVLHSEMSPLSDLRGSTAFRRVVVENLFLRFFREHAGITIRPLSALAPEARA